MDSSVVPHLNGSCGRISIWHWLDLIVGDKFYHFKGPWPLSLFSKNAYRWTLLSWQKRVKIMLSLLEFVEEVYEKRGVRYHLCNISGLMLFQLPNYEIAISEEILLLSSAHIAKKLSKSLAIAHRIAC
ncbi:hypothetical protein Btru_073730 [Bulinus truncatus]|nr:hypothetical protein Btru_073730 [Bulinus truncatus]